MWCTGLGGTHKRKISRIHNRELFEQIAAEVGGSKPAT
jgi:hypothetical protein